MIQSPSISFSCTSLLNIERSNVKVQGKRVNKRCNNQYLSYANYNEIHNLGTIGKWGTRFISWSSLAYLYRVYFSRHYFIGYRQWRFSFLSYHLYQFSILCIRFLPYSSLSESESESLPFSCFQRWYRSISSCRYVVFLAFLMNGCRSNSFADGLCCQKNHHMNNKIKITGNSQNQTCSEDYNLTLKNDCQFNTTHDI